MSYTKRREFLPLLLAWALIWLCGRSALAQKANSLPVADAQRLQALVRAEMSARSIPGLSIAIAINGRLCYANGYGIADREKSLPVAPDTVFRLASISKPITATAVMYLVEQGKIRLDDPIQKYVPAFPHKPWPITIRQLLSHQGGIRHYKGGEIDSNKHYTSLTQSLEIFQHDPLAHEPGSAYLYSTYGYTLLGCAVESASGMKFADYLQTCIFNRAGMKHISIDDSTVDCPELAQGYVKAADGVLTPSATVDTSSKIPGGGLRSTPSDLVAFALALENGQLVQADTLRLMFQPQPLNNGQRTGYGLGWNIGSHRGAKLVSHSGGQPRVSTLLYTLPDYHFVVAIMCNLEGADLHPLAQQIADLLLR